jgi:hypothetical protein
MAIGWFRLVEEDAHCESAWEYFDVDERTAESYSSHPAGADLGGESYPRGANCPHALGDNLTLAQPP